MFRAPIYNMFRSKFYRSTLVTAFTLASFVFNTCSGTPSLSDIDFKYANCSNFDFEGMEDNNFCFSDINKADDFDDVLENLEGINSEILSKSLFLKVKKIVIKKILYKYIKDFTSLSPQEKHLVMGKKLRSFRKFVSKVSGKKISKDSLYKSFKNKVKELDLPVDTSKCKHLFYYKNESHPIAKGNPVSKAAYPCFEDENEEALGTLYIGCILIACGTLVGVIPIAFPPCAPICYGISSCLMGLGISNVHDGLNKGRDLKKKN